MSYPRASCVWVFKTGISIVIRDHLGIPLYAKSPCLLGVFYKRVVHIDLEKRKNP